VRELWRATCNFVMNSFKTWTPSSFQTLHRTFRSCMYPWSYGVGYDETETEPPTLCSPNKDFGPSEKGLTHLFFDGLKSSFGQSNSPDDLACWCVCSTHKMTACWCSHAEVSVELTRWQHADVHMPMCLSNSQDDSIMFACRCV